MTVLAMSMTTQDDAAMDVLQLEEKLTAYWNAVTLITANAHAISKTVLEPGDAGALPSWWPTLSANFKACQGHAQDWISEIYPSLTAIPQAIINFENAFTVTSGLLLDLLAQIQKQPTEELKAQFVSVLKYLLEQLGESMKDIESTKASIKKFTDDMAADHRALSTGSASIQKAIDDSQGTVAQLLTRIEFLKLEIDKLNMQLTVAAIALTTTVTVSYALMNVAPYVAIAIAIIGIGTSTGFIIDALVRLRQYQNEIIEDAQRIEREKRLVVILKAMAATIDSMLVGIDAISKHIDTVSSAWATISVKMKAVTDDLERAQGRQWVDIILKQLDIRKAQTSWKQLREYCEKLQEAMLTQSGTVVPVKAA
ncbi:MAG TPA: HBL/NHE enterotoxin family protein [Thermoanaerobaculia bacterium]|nr:HBL/NHE enterotoxin family protein [Thermoanaerobaculia bacterium]